ncbi:hypothetical protein QJS10_CPB14g01201 [Acorus calamus]|uniref:Uncharacterized protein n=1 Tax=Acorus calamus TaxID=4465 RepID=A0AAV9DEF6_ACOCL|nr:hypothetical protein QJS10_CPB14g01201 [Acorus calamus]
MEASKALVPVSSTVASEGLHVSEAESPFSCLLYEVFLNALYADVSQQVQAAMENMLKTITLLLSKLLLLLLGSNTSDIDQSSSGINEDIEQCKGSVAERKKILEEEKERFQKAAFSVLEMLNDQDIS